MRLSTLLALLATSFFVLFVTGGGPTVNHANLTGVNPNDHHDRYSDAEAVAAVAASGYYYTKAEVDSLKAEVEASVTTEAEVEAFVTNGPIDLHAYTTVGGTAISTGAHTSYGVSNGLALNATVLQLDPGVFTVTAGTTNSVQVQGDVFSRDIRATKYYDKDNTSYYLDPAATGTSLNVAGDIVAAGTVTSSSDLRMKDNIEPITDAVQKVHRLNGVTYTRADLKDPERRYAGLIAQDVEKVLPEAVSGAETKALDYSGTIGLLVEAIKEQQQAIQKLTERIEYLETR